MNFLLNILTLITPTIYANDWTTIPMPSKSMFAGLDTPTDANKWAAARDLAASGEQILLRKVLNKIKNPMDFIQGKIAFKDIHAIGDVFVSKASGGLTSIKKQYSNKRAPITLFGFRTFDGGSRFEGKEQKFDGFHPEALQDHTGNLPRKMVVVGAMDENWGYLSTVFTNRTATWGLGHGPKKGTARHDDHKKFLMKLLDDPNMLFLLSNQHFNISHPKVLSYPLGMTDPKLSWDVGHRVLKRNIRKETSKYIIFSAGSDWGPRPLIRKCVERLLGPSIESYGKKKGQSNPFTPSSFKIKLASSVAVLAMSGFGFDTYRLWETLSLGSIPVLERGFGFERTLWKLPALFVDDYSDLTADIIRVAYVEALYRADEWEYERLARKHWQDLIFQTSVSENLDYVLEKHPMKALDEKFCRPLTYYNCERMGGCGRGTMRTPYNTCNEVTY